MVGAGGYSAPTPFRPPRAVPEMLCSARDFTVPKAYRGFWAASTYTTFGGSHLTLSATKQKTDSLESVSVLVGAGGFEPPKSKTTDLQSAPFGHSGTLPYLVFLQKSEPAERNLTFDLLIKRQPLLPLSYACSLRFLTKNWSWWTDSNPRPADYKSAALPTELHQLV